ncbi:hypothetical protein PBY51_006049 [Eleginops maclovinus]|uniref:Uncharacterized protein n=1 Tax=Eleginops maclovinus TaxID=56733 RepID=A0AAN7WPU0_ELEMC|nr:hypothetical protein PBY51_006049 [Eleginops maclovinus]
MEGRVSSSGLNLVPPPPVNYIPKTTVGLTPTHSSSPSSQHKPSAREHQHPLGSTSQCDPLSFLTSYLRRQTQFQTPP